MRPTTHSDPMLMTDALDPAAGPGSADDRQRARAQWNARRAEYMRPRPLLSSAQVFGILAAHLALDGALWWAWSRSIGLTLVLLVINSLALNRLFVLFHDLMHGSLYRSRPWADALGSVLGLFVLVPAKHWQLEHNRHHAAANDLSRRGLGDMPVLTVREYAQRSALRRAMYRVLRHPLVLFTVYGVYRLFLFPRVVAAPSLPRAAHRSVYLTNAALLLIGLGLWWAGLGLLVLIQGLSVALSAPNTMILFYINHHYEGSRWAGPEAWTFESAAIEGSSMMIYPQPIRWFSANIGLHAVHHLAPRIPNYNLERCSKDNRIFDRCAVLGMRELWAAMRLRLWDEHAGRYVGWHGGPRANEAVADRRL